MAIRILSSENITGNLTLHSSSNAPYIDFVESGATTDSKARITMDQVDTNNGQLIFMPPNIVKVPTLLLLNKDNKLLIGNDVYNYIRPQVHEEKRIAVKNNGEIILLSPSYERIQSFASFNVVGD